MTTIKDDAKRWNHFRSFVESLKGAAEPSELLETLLLGIVELLDAERGFVLLKRPGASRMVPVAAHRIEDTEAFIEVSSTVYKAALADKTTVYIKNSFEDNRCCVARSIREAPTPRTIVCGPLMASDVSFGVLYIDMPIKENVIERASIELFETITGLTSHLLAASQTRQKLLSAQTKMQAMSALSFAGQRLIIGDSKAGSELRECISTAASQDVTTLIRGETGTGKEMVAQAIHRLSARNIGPFVAVNCAALPRDIIEAELFGTEKGAFTGATERRIGRFELAAGGTLFLDELGELSLDTQVKLLRVLQEREITRLGGKKAIPLDFRLICATNADLEQSIENGTLRRDFYFRINVFSIALKPLRERTADIEPLAAHFTREYCARFGKGDMQLSPDTLKAMCGYEWPGNVRELRNAIERAVLLSNGEIIGPASLPLGTSTAAAKPDGLESVFWSKLPDDYDQAREIFERTFLKRLLERHGGKIRAAARASGIPRSTIYRRLTKFGLVAEDE